MLERRTGTANPVRSARDLTRSLAELHALYAARAGAAEVPREDNGHTSGTGFAQAATTFQALVVYLDRLIEAMQERIRQNLEGEPDVEPLRNRVRFAQHPG